MWSSSSPNVLVFRTMKASMFYFKVGLGTPLKEQQLGKRVSAKFHFKQGCAWENTETRHEMKDCKKTTLHLLKIHRRCRLVFLHSNLSSHALLLHSFRSIPITKKVLLKPFFSFWFVFIWGGLRKHLSNTRQTCLLCWRQTLAVGDECASCWKLTL